MLSLLSTWTVVPKAPSVILTSVPSRPQKSQEKSEEWKEKDSSLLSSPWITRSALGILLNSSGFSSALNLLTWIMSSQITAYLLGLSLREVLWSHKDNCAFSPILSPCATVALSICFDSDFCSKVTLLSYFQPLKNKAWHIVGIQIMLCGRLYLYIRTQKGLP